MPARQTPAEKILNNFQGTGREWYAIPEHKDLTFPLKQQRAALLPSNFFACNFLSIFIADVQLGCQRVTFSPRLAKAFAKLIGVMWRKVAQDLWVSK